MITIEDIHILQNVFSNARRYAGETKDINVLDQLINYESDLKNRIKETINKLENGKNRKPKYKAKGSK